MTLPRCSQRAGTRGAGRGSITEERCPWAILVLPGVLFGGPDRRRNGASGRPRVRREVPSQCIDESAMSASSRDESADRKELYESFVQVFARHEPGLRSFVRL